MHREVVSREWPLTETIDRCSAGAGGYSNHSAASHPRSCPPSPSLHMGTHGVQSPPRAALPPLKHHAERIKLVKYLLLHVKRRDPRSTQGKAYVSCWRISSAAWHKKRKSIYLLVSGHVFSLGIVCMLRIFAWNILYTEEIACLTHATSDKQKEFWVKKCGSDISVFLHHR